MDENKNLNPETQETPETNTENTENTENMENPEVNTENAENAENPEAVPAPAPKKRSFMRKKNGKIKKWPIICAAIAAVLIGAVIGNIRLNNTLIPTFYQVESTKVSNNIRVVCVADMHLKEFGNENQKLVDAIASYHPDIIAIPGDMNIESNPDYSEVINVMTKLKDVAPVYYSLGNHEIDAMLFNDSKIYTDVKQLGIHILNNEMETVKIGDSQIDIIGLTQGPKTYADYGAEFFTGVMMGGNFKLVLTHYPENFLGVIEDFPIDLALCGHAHGGLIRIPFVGGLYAPDQGFFPKLTDGYHEESNSKFIVNRGLSTSGIVPRINNGPEISVIDINWY